MGVLPGQCGREPRQWREAAHRGLNSAANGPHAQPSTPGCSPAGAGTSCLQEAPVAQAAQGNRENEGQVLGGSCPRAPELKLLPRRLRTPPKSWRLPLPAGSPTFCLATRCPRSARWKNNELEDPTCRLSHPALPNRTFCDDVNLLYLQASIWQPRVPTADWVCFSPPPPPQRHCILHEFLHQKTKRKATSQPTQKKADISILNSLFGRSSQARPIRLNSTVFTAC